MTDLDEIVESFKLNIDRIAPERLAEIVGLLDAVPRDRLNHILDKIAIEVHMDNGNQLQFEKGSDWTIQRFREEIQKAV